MSNKKTNTFLVILFLLSVNFLFNYPQNDLVNASRRSSQEISNNELIDVFPNNSFLKNINYILGKTSTLKSTFQIEGRAIIFDSTGNSFFTGVLVPNFQDESDIIIGKQNSTGYVEWVVQYSYLNKDEIYDITLDEESNRLFIIGSTINKTKIIFSEMFIGCYNTSNGLNIWNTTFGETNKSEIGYKINFIDGKLYIVGTATDYLQIDTNPDILFACFSENGILLKSEINNTIYYDYNPSFCYNSDEETFFLIFNRKIEIDSETLNQYILRKINLNGTIIWEKNSITESDIKINDMKNIQTDKSLLLIGEIKELSNNESNDIAILQLNYSGNLTKSIVWGKKDVNEIGLTIAIDQKKNIFFSGYTKSDFTNQNVAFLTKLDNQMKENWFGKFHNYMRSKILDLAVSKENQIVMVGNCEANYDYIYVRLLVAFTIDEDDDGLSTFFEEILGTNPKIFDTDGDGYSDGEEYRKNTDPLNSKSNPNSRSFWNNFSIIFTISLIIIFIVINFVMKSREEYKIKSQNSEINTKSWIVKVTEKFFSLFRRNK
ncbi:MAG TPA: thrombospondin type 3 repeat-containing protein [candidate division Zixibacteria bacterium]|nr:thrombospondin type 3 repeat-containing protein [candidate division Zixibacteria bacterium]